MDIFVVIDNRKVTLINHVYCYSLVFDDDEQYFSMVKKFDEVLEAKKQSVEDEMTNNVKNSLKIILSKVKNSPSKP
jgi:GTP-binding protein EngB required for normal cell division